MATGTLVDTASRDTSQNQKANHSEVFYHDGAWWGILRYSDEDYWIWKRNSAGNWTRQTGPGALATRSTDYVDVVVDNAANRFWAYFGHTSSSKIYSMTYSGGAWSTDVSDVTVTGIVGGSTSCLAVARRWSTTTLLAVEYKTSAVNISHSTDNGATWGTETEILGSLGHTAGHVDALEFSWDSGSGSNNYLGVFVGPNASDDFYFVYIKEGDTITTAGNWTTENVSTLSSYQANAADDHVAIIRDGSTTNNRLYAVFKRGAGTGPTHGVFKRDNNTSGTWSVVENSLAESRPGIAYDETNDEVYVFSHNGSGGATPIEYEKSAAPTLSFGSGVTFLEDSTDVFNSVVAPHDPVTSTTGLLMVGGNHTDGTVWENLLTIAAPAGGGLIPTNPVRNLHHLLRR
jgi:hypothetical protein